MFGYKLIKKEELYKLEDEFSKFESHVFSNMAMMDGKGRSQGNYNKYDVDLKWDRYHVLHSKVWFAIKKLRGFANSQNET
jgi:hypothetical protein